MDRVAGLLVLEARHPDGGPRGRRARRAPRRRPHARRRRRGCPCGSRRPRPAGRQRRDRLERAADVPAGLEAARVSLRSPTSASARNWPSIPKRYRAGAPAAAQVGSESEKNSRVATSRQASIPRGSWWNDQTSTTSSRPEPSSEQISFDPIEGVPRLPVVVTRHDHVAVGVRSELPGHGHEPAAPAPGRPGTAAPPGDRVGDDGRVLARTRACDGRARRRDLHPPTARPSRRASRPDTARAAPLRLPRGVRRSPGRRRGRWSTRKRPRGSRPLGQGHLPGAEKKSSAPPVTPPANDESAAPDGRSLHHTTASA